jgi:hypothetical protein
MPSTITRQKIMDAVIARLAAITGPATYYTNFGGRVFDWRKTPIGNDELPALNVMDPDDVALLNEMKGGGTDLPHDLTVIVSVPVFGTSADMRKAIADVYKAISTDETWGGLAYLTDPLGDTINVAQEDRRVLSVDITLQIKYKTTKWEES